MLGCAGTGNSCASVAALPIGQAAGVGLVMGSEGQGLSQEAKQNALSVAIPMHGGADSLNVSQAGAILMFMLSDALWPLAGRLHGEPGLLRLAACTAVAA